MIKDKIKKTYLFLIFFVIFFACTDKSPGAEDNPAKNSNIRNAAVSGIFYPANPDELNNMIKYFFDQVKLPPLAINPKILVSPHAGYVYSGPVAAYGYKAIQGFPFKTIIILGPAHTEYFQGASIYTDGYFATPLGKVEIDSLLAKKILKETPLFNDKISPHIKEHSLEVQIPFLQYILKNFKIVPIVIGDIKNINDYKIIADSISNNIKNRNDVLIIASTDLSHYYSYEIAQKMDSIAIDGILRIDTDFLIRRVFAHECELCGFNPVIVALNIAKSLEGVNKAVLLNKANSGDTSGNKEQVVGYASIAIGKSIGNETMSELTQDEKKGLLKIARDTIFSYVKERKIPKIENITNQKFLAHQGAFVTIKINHNLRGCIGTFTSDKPLYRTIIDMAVSSSTQDPRFNPLSADELKNISLEISVLSELKLIKNVDEIKVGTHGIYIIRGYYRGVLLPQVATEYKWDRDTFLQQTCFKAGLPADAWKDPNTEIYIFSAQVFGEE